MPLYGQPCWILGPYLALKYRPRLRRRYFSSPLSYPHVFCLCIEKHVLLYPLGGGRGATRPRDSHPRGVLDYSYCLCLMSLGFKRRNGIFVPYRSLRRVVYKFACFDCGLRFTIKRQVRGHVHNYVASIKDYLLEYSV